MPVHAHGGGAAWGEDTMGQNRVHVLSIVMITASFLGAIILSILLAIT
jgi:hypothetical protein